MCNKQRYLCRKVKRYYIWYILARSCSLMFIFKIAVSSILNFRLWVWAKYCQVKSGQNIQWCYDKKYCAPWSRQWKPHFILRKWNFWKVESELRLNPLLLAESESRLSSTLLKREFMSIVCAARVIPHKYKKIGQMKKCQGWPTFLLNWCVLGWI
jgi:hypothetical protein